VGAGKRQSVLNCNISQGSVTKRLRVGCIINTFCKYTAEHIDRSVFDDFEIMKL